LRGQIVDVEKRLV